MSTVGHAAAAAAEAYATLGVFWTATIIFVGGVVKVSLIKMMSLRVLALTQGNMLATSMIVMWFSAIASAIVNNIPYVATMNPLVIDMT